MYHYLETEDGKRVTVNAYCGHDEIKDMYCPIGYGDCESCQYMKVELTGPGAGSVFKHLYHEGTYLKRRNEEANRKISQGIRDMNNLDNTGC